MPYSLRIRVRNRGIFLIFLLAVAGILTYLYFLYRPPYALYSALERNELASAQDLLSKHSKDHKFVVLKQLQGAGFNNQVSAFQIILIIMLIFRSKKYFFTTIWPSLHLVPTYSNRSSGDRDTTNLSRYLRFFPVLSEKQFLSLYLIRYVHPKTLFTRRSILLMNSVGKRPKIS